MKTATVGDIGDTEWPDFYDEAIQLDGAPVSQIVLDGREERI